MRNIKGIQMYGYDYHNKLINFIKGVDITDLYVLRENGAPIHKDNIKFTSDFGNLVIYPAFIKGSCNIEAIPHSAISPASKSIDGKTEFYWSENPMEFWIFKDRSKDIIIKMINQKSERKDSRIVLTFLNPFEQIIIESPTKTSFSLLSEYEYILKERINDQFMAIEFFGEVLSDVKCTP